MVRRRYSSTWHKERPARLELVLAPIEEAAWYGDWDSPLPFPVGEILRAQVRSLDSITAEWLVKRAICREQSEDLPLLIGAAWWHNEITIIDNPMFVWRKGGAAWVEFQ